MIDGEVKSALLTALREHTVRLLAKSRADAATDIATAIGEIPSISNYVDWKNELPFRDVYLNNEADLLKTLPNGKYFGRIQSFAAEGVDAPVAPIPAFLELVVFDSTGLEGFTERNVWGYFTYQFGNHQYVRLVSSHDEDGNAVTEYGAFFRNLTNVDGAAILQEVRVGDAEDVMALIVAIDNIGLQYGELSKTLDGTVSKGSVEFKADGNIGVTSLLGENFYPMVVRLLPAWVTPADYSISLSSNLGDASALETTTGVFGLGFVAFADHTVRFKEVPGASGRIENFTVEVKHVGTGTITPATFQLVE